MIDLAKLVGFEALAINANLAAPLPPNIKADRPPYSALMMIATLALQQIYNLTYGAPG